MAMPNLSMKMLTTPLAVSYDPHGYIISSNGRVLAPLVTSIIFLLGVEREKRRERERER